MNNKYTKEERFEIAKEGIEVKDKSIVSLKYEIHLSTLYAWITELKSLDDGNKYLNEYLTVKITKNQKELLCDKCSKLGYGNDISSYVRKVLFSKHIASGNPCDIIKELYSARGEINKVGSNLNQIANYTNFLMNQNYAEDSYGIELKKVLQEFLKVVSEHRTVVDKTINKI